MRISFDLVGFCVDLGVEFEVLVWRWTPLLNTPSISFSPISPGQLATGIQTKTLTPTTKP